MHPGRNEGSSCQDSIATDADHTAGGRWREVRGRRGVVRHDRNAAAAPCRREGNYPLLNGLSFGPGPDLAINPQGVR